MYAAWLWFRCVYLMLRGTVLSGSRLTGNSFQRLTFISMMSTNRCRAQLHHVGYTSRLVIPHDRQASRYPKASRASRLRNGVTGSPNHRLVHVRHGTSPLHRRWPNGRGHAKTGTGHRPAAFMSRTLANHPAVPRSPPLGPSLDHVRYGVIWVYPTAPYRPCRSMPSHLES